MEREMKNESNGKGVVLLVDDDRAVLDATSMLLGIHGYRVIVCDDASNAVKILDDKNVDIVLADLMAQGARGMELLEKARTACPRVPVLLMAGHADVDAAVEMVKKGAFDFIVKPYRADPLLLDIARALEHAGLLAEKEAYRDSVEESVGRVAGKLRVDLHALKDSSIEVISRLAAAVEFKGKSSGDHIFRMGVYSRRLAEELSMGPDFVENIVFASAMHDIGKIGIPERLLLKKGALSAPEFEIMKTHTMVGHRLLDGSQHEMLRMAATVALTHHEKWDGSGYPYGLKGSEIPVEGMIVMLADHYDIMRSSRSYKGPMTHEEAVSAIMNGNGRSRVEHYHPGVLEAFCRISDEFEGIYEARAELPTSFSAAG